MEARIALGGSLDICTPGELADAVSGLRSHLDTKFAGHARTPRIYRTPAAAANVPIGGGVITLVPGSPATGRIWNVTRVLLTGSDDHTPVAGTVAALYVGDSANPDLASVVWPGVIAVPGALTFSKEVLWVKPSEELFVVISGNAVAANIMVNASVTETEY